MANVSLKYLLSGVDEVARGFDQVLSKIDVTKKGVERFNEGVGNFAKGMRSLGDTLSIAVTAPLTLLGRQFVKASNDADSAHRRFTTMFKGMETSASAFVQTMGRAFGVSESDVENYMASIATLGQQMGLSREATLSMSQAVTSLSFDFASFFNIGFDEAFRAIQGGLLGAGRELRRMGIDLSDTRVKADLLRMGLIKQGQELSSQQETYGRYISLLAQTSQMQGDFATHLESPTNRLRVLGMQIQDVSEDLGAALMPGISAVVSAIQSALPWIREKINAWMQLDPVVKGASLTLLGFVTVLGPLLRIMGTAIELVRGLAAAMIFLTTSSGGIVAVVVALAAGLALGARYSTEFATSLQNFATGLRQAAIGAGPLAAVVAALADAFASLNQNIPKSFTDESGAKGMIVPLQRSQDAVTRIVGQIKSAFAGMFEEVGKSASLSGSQIAAMYDKAAKDAAAAWGQLPNAIKKEGEASSQHAKKLMDEFDQWVEAKFQFERATNAKSLEDLREGLQARLDSVRAETAEEIRLRTQIAEINADISKRDVEVIVAASNARIQSIELADKSTASWARNSSRAQQQIRDEIDATRLKLEIMRENFVLMGAEGGRAVEEIDQAMERLGQQGERTDQRMATLLGQIALNTSGVANAMRGAFSQFFQDMLSGTFNLGRGMVNIFRAIVDSIIAEFARLAADYVFQVLFGSGGAGAGASVGQQVLQSRGGSLLGGDSGLGIFGAISQGISGFNSSFSSGVASLFFEVGSWFDDAGSSFIAMQLGQLGASISPFIGPILGSIMSFIQGDIASGIASAALGIIGGLVGGPFGGILGSLLGGFFGGLFQSGTDRVFSRPTLIGVGETGAERVSVTPLGGGMHAGGGPMVVFSGPVIMDDIAMNRFVREIMRIGRDQSRRYV